jgi:hypothetical protein
MGISKFREVMAEWLGRFLPIIEVILSDLYTNRFFMLYQGYLLHIFMAYLFYLLTTLDQRKLRNG